MWVVAKNKSKDLDSDDVPWSTLTQDVLSNVNGVAGRYKDQSVVEWKVGDMVVESNFGDSAGIGIIVKVWAGDAQYAQWGGPYMIYLAKEQETFWVIPCFMRQLP